MNRVLLDRFAEVFADRAGVGLGWVGGAHDLAQMGNRGVALESSHVDRSRGHVLDQVVEERAFTMHAVKALSMLLREADLSEAEDAEALALEARDDLAD